MSIPFLFYRAHICMKCSLGISNFLEEVSSLSHSDGVPVELFQILKDDPLSAALDMRATLENSAVATGLEKVSFHSNPKAGQCQ